MKKNSASAKRFYILSMICAVLMFMSVFWTWFPSSVKAESDVFEVVTEKESDEAAALTAISVIWNDVADTAANLSHAEIIGVNDSGVICWTTQTDDYEMVGDFAIYVELGTDFGQFYYYEHNFLKCLNVEDGELLWSIEIPLTNIVGSVFGDDGTLFLGAVYCTPDFVAVSSQGVILAELMLSEESTSCYPCDFSWKDGIVSLTIRDLWNVEEPIYMEVDVSDYSFSRSTIGEVHH